MIPRKTENDKDEDKDSNMIESSNLSPKKAAIASEMAQLKNKLA